MVDDSETSPIFDDHAAEQYLQEIIQQASAGILAARATILAASGAATAGDLFVNARSVANAAAMISKILWPGSPRKAGDEDEALFERRKRLAKKRGTELRKMLDVGDDNIVKNRRVRDAIEHFDERLDRRLSSHDRSIVKNNTGPADMIQIEGTVGPFHLHHYDPRTTEYTILGDSMRISDVENELINIFNSAHRAMSDIEKRRWGSKR